MEEHRPDPPMEELPEAEIVVTQPGIMRNQDGEYHPETDLVVLVNGERVARLMCSKVEWWVDYEDHTPKLRVTLNAGDSQVRSLTGRDKARALKETG